MHIEVKTLTSVEYSDNGLELSTKDFERLDSIARSLSAKYHGWYGLVYDDIYEGVWEKISSLIKDGVRDFALIYRCSKNKVMDSIRQAQNRQARGFDVDEELMDKALYRGLYDSYDAYNNMNSTHTKWNPDFNEMYVNGKVAQDCLEFVDLLRLFEKGSREWEWLYLVGIRNKIIEIDPRIYNRMFSDDHTVDSEVSKLMGYNHQSNNGYRAIKWRVQNKVAEYLGLPR